MKTKIKSNTLAVAEQTNKLRVLLVPDFLAWILGTWAKQIAHVGSAHEYFLFSEQMIPLYTDEWESLLNVVDVVHFLNQWEVKSIIVPAHLPVITSIHHVVDEDEWKEQLLPLVEADAVMTVAEEWRSFVLEKGVPIEKLYLFHNGVDTTRFYPYKNKFAARKRLGIHSSSNLIGYSAKYTSNYGGRKGIEIFLQAVKMAADEGAKFGVLLTGPGWDDAVGQIRSYGIEVHYRPFLPDRVMPTLYNALDIYVVTSRIEGGPVPLIESMACGVPPVTTPVGLARKFIHDDVNGLVIPKDDVPATAQAILHLLTFPELRQRLASAALQTIRDNLTWDKTLAGIERIYTQAWESKTRNSKPVDSTTTINPARQRNWAINVDSYLWHQQLYNQGYYTEGLRGMLESSWQVEGKNTLKLLCPTFDTIRSHGFKKVFRALL